MKSHYPMYLAGEAITPNRDLEVQNKFDSAVAARVPLASPEHIEKAIEAAVSAEAEMAALPAYQRAEILQHGVRRFQERFEELAEVLCIEAGKPIADARGEVTRLIDTFRVAAEEATRIGGEFMPLDISPRAKGVTSITRHVPVGACSFISPFNFPLNLTAHKVAPAIAAGCPFVLKPSSRTPVGALIIGEVLAETDLPGGAFSILPCRRDGAALFTEDDRLKLLSFTGSQDVGWELKARAGRKKVVLELGGNAGCIVDEGADLEHVADRITFGAFYQSGQSCISAQRVLIHESLYERLVQKLVMRAKELKMGDPRDESTSLGPIITRAEAERIEEWIEEAVDHGAEVLCGGERNGGFINATYLADVNPDDRVSAQEVFGPVATLQPFSDFKSAIDTVNDSIYGLQAGVFTQNLDHAFYAWNRLQVGGVVINDVPSFRVDSMPYGGVKHSGLGREGIRYSIEDMSELRLLVLNNVGRGTDS